MATGKITKDAVDKMDTPPAGKREYLWDQTLKGFGCMLTDNGTRSYIVQYRIGGRGSSTRRVTIGKHGSPWTPATARVRAAELLEQVRRKIDPFEHQVQELAAARAAQEAEERATAELSELAFDVVMQAYFEHITGKLKTAKEIKGTMTRDLEPVFASQPLTQISADDINDALIKIGERAPSAYRHAYMAMSGMFTFAHKKHSRLFPKSKSPFPDVISPEQSGARDRFLTNSELRLLWLAADEIGWPFGPIYQLLFLTSTRLREISDGHWNEIDLSEARWNIPKTRTKNKRPHWVHLPPQALRIIEQLPRIENEKEFIFTTTLSTAVSGFSKGKERLVKAMLQLAQKEAEAAGHDPKKIKIEPFRLHDARRTTSRGFQRLEVPPHVVDRLTGHVGDSEKGVRKNYQIWAYEMERVRATNLWADEIDRIVKGLPTSAMVKWGGE